MFEHGKAHAGAVL
jgi:hypothetical protein